MLIDAEDIVNKKNNIDVILRNFLADNKYKSHTQYQKLKMQITFFYSYQYILNSQS